MNGNDSYDNQFNNKINRILEKNRDKKYLRGFLNYLGTKMSLSTKYDYLVYVLWFINYINKDVADIKYDDYTDYLSTLEQKTPSYQISIYSGLKRFSNYLYVSEKNTKDPMSLISRPDPTEKQSTIQKRENGYLNTAEIKKYITSVNNGCGSHRAKAYQKKWKSRDLLIILLLMNTGMRCSALYKLDIDNINMSEHSIIVTEKRGKVQVYNFPDNLDEYINNWIEKRNEILGSSNEVALFISNQKRRMDQTTISKIVNKYAKVINGKNITPHKLRATYGTQLYEKTKDVYFVQSCMGHSSPKTTELYIRGQKDTSRKEASNIISKIIF